ncbi:MAG: hypothetical protein KJO32_01000, partial [Deltaproteobacteria bacterium]|nr:hypothetical protein [Deltaproteobacteria bacterium]
MHTKRTDGHFTLLITLICFIACSMVPLTLSAMSERSATLLEQTIISLNKVRISISESQLDKTEQAQQSPNSREDVLLFLSYLDGRIYYYCQDLLLVRGPEGLAGLPCPGGTGSASGAPQFGPLPNTSGQTSGEKVAQLENDFNAALGEFDDMLLEEQETVAAHIPKQRENRSSGSSTYDAEKGLPTWQTSGKPSSSDQQARTDGSQTGTSQDPSSQDSARSANKNGATIGKNNQTKLPPTAGQKDLSKDDDDIVARQLREAAEQETDPEIKAKLW